MATNTLDSVAAALHGRRTIDHPTLARRFLPDPVPRIFESPMISVDDHVVEARRMFDGRLPARYTPERSEATPRIVEQADGSEAWLFDGELYGDIGFGAVAGRPPEDFDVEPSRFEHMRKGCWDAAARIADMDSNGISASLNFPNMLPGFAGQRFAKTRDPGLGLALIRAWNDWLMEEWVEPYRDRFIPCQLTWLNDVDLAAREIRRNADRGFRAVSFTEAPQKLGLPSLHTGYWDPLLRACEETQTVVCFHVGSSSSIYMTADDAPVETVPLMFPISAMFSTVDWLYSGVARRFPDLKLVPAEGGIGWVPGLIDRLEHIEKHRPHFSSSRPSPSADLTQTEVLRRNFWFCAIDDPSGFDAAARIGLDNILVESDYPHADSSWPNTHETLRAELTTWTDDDISRVFYGNARDLFRFAPTP